MSISASVRGTPSVERSRRRRRVASRVRPRHGERSRTPVELLPQLSELAEVSRSFESAAGVVGRSSGRPTASATGLVLAASFQDCVLIDLDVPRRHPGIEVASSTPALSLRRDALVRRAGAQPVQPEPLRDHAPSPPLDNLWLTDPYVCCNALKVEPLARALWPARTRWMTGLRRDEVCRTRQRPPIVAL